VIIKRFRATGLHGYLKFDLAFDQQLTFLTGINGSGKTTVVNSIVALISPSLYVLANLVYDRMSIDITNGETKITISAVGTENGFSLSTSQTQSPLPVPKYVVDPDIPPGRNFERENDYYRDFATLNVAHEVLKIINDLPTPMFLDLERRTRDTSERPLIGHTRVARRGRNIFSVLLNNSLIEAVALSELYYRREATLLQQKGDELRAEIISVLLEMEPSGGMVLSVPKQSEIEAIQNMRRYAGSIPQILKMPDDQVLSRINPFLASLEEIAKKIPKTKTVQNIIKRSQEDNDAFRALISWSQSIGQFEKLKKVIRHVERYNDEKRQITTMTTDFLTMIGKFFRDSGKEIGFDSVGDLVFTREDLKRPISALSSGEVQMIVIIAHLFFNEAAQKANVFIIDEPELSLHVQWQELFVESILDANPSIQYILATHSPSIILNRTTNCRDLVQRQVAN